MKNLNYKNLNKRKIITDFKSFNEGLITSYSYHKIKELIENKLNQYNLKYEIELTSNNIYLKLNLNDKNKQLFNDLISILNVTGYYISNWNQDNSVLKSKKLTLIDFLNTKNVIELYLNKKYDFEDNSIKTILYHVTTKEKYDKIKKIGLTPKTNNILENHSDRIYLFDNLDECYEYIKIKRKTTTNDYIILRIDLRLIDKIKLYLDPKYELFDGAYYTYDNIEPFAIEKY